MLAFIDELKIACAAFLCFGALSILFASKTKHSNVLTSLVHSALVSILVVLTATASYSTSNSWPLQALRSFSLGYFAYDVIDMYARNAAAKLGVTIFLHHASVIGVLVACQLCGDKFAKLNALMLVAEFNSVSMHARTVMLRVFDVAPRQSIVYAANMRMFYATFWLFRVAVMFCVVPPLLVHGLYTGKFGQSAAELAIVICALAAIVMIAIDNRLLYIRMQRSEHRPSIKE
jgi:TLC domain